MVGGTEEIANLKSVLLLVADGSEDMEVAITQDILRRVEGVALKIVGVPSIVNVASTSKTDEEQRMLNNNSNNTSISKTEQFSSFQIITLSKGMKIIPDETIEQTISNLQKKLPFLPDMIIIPGGYLGVKNIRNNKLAKDLIEKQLSSKNGKVAAICAGPLVLLDLYKEDKLKFESGIGNSQGKIQDLHMTSWPKFERDFLEVKNDIENGHLERKNLNINWVAHDSENKGVIVDKNIITSQGPGTNFEFALRLLEELDLSTEEIDRVRRGILY